MSDCSEEEARQIIAKVRKNNGGITTKERDTLLATLPDVAEALQCVRRTLANSIKIVVDNLYSKETRFLYELIQNAEDNTYSTATAKGDKAFLSFRLYPDRVLVDSNEDGFTKSNIEAISSVAQSTKKHSAGYIGEKGIGFKSVFKIAQKVHIQSGPFSFAFSHSREDDDDGLGMITPYYEDPEDLPPRVRTRMALTLIDSSNFEGRAFEFQNVPDTFLMFLNRLQQLSVELCKPGHPSTLTQYSKRESEQNGLFTTFLTKTSTTGKKISTQEQKYITTKSDLQDLPSDEARRDKEGHSIDHATVILAFPVDEHDGPVLKPQYTYAFLPIRRVGFKFLIQSDFVTQANREDVVHSKRNRAVLEGVAEAFADAMVMFCGRPSLKYKWMRYLPEEFITDEFWGALWTSVREKLEQTPLLESWSGTGLSKPSALQRLSEDYIDEDGDPLLADLEWEEVYLSPSYEEADFKILERLGTKTLQWDKFVDRLDEDVLDLSDSYWKSMKKSADWRTRICNILLKAFTENNLDQRKRLKSFAFIPLQDGRWVSIASGIKIYHSKTDKIPIPSDLGLNLVSSEAAENVAWAQLLSHLGVVSCPPQHVIKLINERYNNTKASNFTTANAVAHIQYIYWFSSKDRSCLAPQIRLLNQYGALLKKDQYLYFPNGADDYSPSNLFKQDAQAPGYPVHYLHEDYLKAVDPDVTHNGRTWVQWLEQVALVRRIPELCATDNNSLSKEFQYIIKYRSDRMLGVLKRGWTTYHLSMNAVEDELWDSDVLMENGERTTLTCASLPFPKLKKIATQLGLADAYPFVAMAEQLRDQERLDWGFAEDLLIGIDENLFFYLTALSRFKTINPSFDDTSTRDQLMKVYHSIQSRSSENFELTCSMFEQSLIWVPPSARTDDTWLPPTDCVWNGPEWLQSKQRLKIEVYLDLEHLIKVSLKIPDAAQLDVINDLLLLKSQSGDEETLARQYTAGYQPNNAEIRPPFQVTSIKETSSQVENFQSIPFMKEYKDQSFEELRLAQYPSEKGFLSTDTSKHTTRAFAALGKEAILVEAEKRYDYLWKTYTSSSDGTNAESRAALRSSFEESALIYVPKKNAWFPPTQCVWVDTSVQIPGKASIADAYPLKKTFFTTVLKVSEPTVDMYVASLVDGANGKASAAQIKETMRLICDLGLGETDLSSLNEAKILPIKLANGSRCFASASSADGSVDFAIVEKTIHSDGFRGKISVLDFSIEDIRDTRPLLQAMNLENRFSSKTVKEVTDVSGGSLDREMTKNLRGKGQAIVRCAVHFAGTSKRQDVASLYKNIKCATVYVSDGIRRSLQIVQHGRTIEGASSRANFHLEEVEGALRLYLPKDEVERDVCLEFDLPHRLCHFLSVTDDKAPGIIGGVYRKDKQMVIEKILENAGVGQVDCDFVALDGALGDPEVDSDAETVVETASFGRHVTPSPFSRPYTPSTWKKPSERLSGSDNVVRGPYNQDWQKNAQEAAYKHVLENTVNVARQRAACGIFESTESSTRRRTATKALSQDTIREAFQTRSYDRDFQIGAAGELYVFEYLKTLGLPQFGFGNWPSDVRDRVCAHSDYIGLKKANDRSAIADIEYLDESSMLTKLLIKEGHLAEELWDDKKPMYHIEVKATTSSKWQEPFYMSTAQEQHIRDHQIEDGKSGATIYLICRIFNLGRGDETGLQVYLDPETRRINGELQFTTHTWAVKPLTHPTMPVGHAIATAPAALTPTSTDTTSGGSGHTDASKKCSATDQMGPGLSAYASGSTVFGSSTFGSGPSVFGTALPTFGLEPLAPASGSSAFGSSSPGTGLGSSFGSSGTNRKPAPFDRILESPLVNVVTASTASKAPGRGPVSGGPKSAFSQSPAAFGVDRSTPTSSLFSGLSSVSPNDKRREVASQESSEATGSKDDQPNAPRKPPLFNFGSATQTGSTPQPMSSTAASVPASSGRPSNNASPNPTSNNNGPLIFSADSATAAAGNWPAANKTSVNGRGRSGDRARDRSAHRR